MSDRRTEISTDPAALAGSLPRDLQPATDLWPGIEARLEDRTELQKNRASRRLWLQAAAVVVLIAASSLLTVVVMDTARDPVSAPNSVVVVSDTPDESGFGAGSASADAAWQSAVTQMVGQMPPDVRAEFAASLDTVRSARHAVEAALEKDPNNAWLRSLWLHAYQQELRLLDDAARATNSLTERLRT